MDTITIHTTRLIIQLTWHNLLEFFHDYHMRRGLLHIRLGAPPGESDQTELQYAGDSFLYPETKQNHVNQKAQYPTLLFQASKVRNKNLYFILQHIQLK